jgi:hypothetical protein
MENQPNPHGRDKEADNPGRWFNPSITHQSNLSVKNHDTHLYWFSTGVCHSIAARVHE